MIQDFQSKVGQAEQQGMSNVQASNGVWDQEVKRILLAEQFEKLGLRVGADQLINVMKENPNFASNPQFLNEAGKFDVAKFKEYVSTNFYTQGSRTKEHNGKLLKLMLKKCLLNKCIIH